MRPVFLAIIVGGLLLFSVTPAATATAGEATQLEAAKAEATEAAAHELQVSADSQGALGIYKVGTTFVVVAPASRSDITTAALANAGVDVRVVAVDVEKATLDRLSVDLEALKPSIKGSYGFGFDPESAKMVLQSEAPIGAFDAVMKAYPGLIDFHPGKWDLTSWQNDGQPHWGGAWVTDSSGGQCTTGFSIADNNGHQYMATAGHCYSNGTTTNIGTASRPNDTYPFYDFEWIAGHLVSGNIYDSATTHRAVKNGWNPSVGSVYCATGRTSGFNCNWTIRRLDQTMCYGTNGECYHSLAAFDRPGGMSVLPGDSGGTLWFPYADGTAGVRGVTSGRFWDITTFHYLSYATQYQQPLDLNVMHALLG
jgi:hypothetical protein